LSRLGRFSFCRGVCDTRWREFPSANAHFPTHFPFVVHVKTTPGFCVDPAIRRKRSFLPPFHLEGFVFFFLKGPPPETPDWEVLVVSKGSKD